MVFEHQLRWAGHVARMDDMRLPKVVFFGELSEGKRNRGFPENAIQTNWRNSYLRRRSNTPHSNRKYLTETIGATSSTKEHDSSRRAEGKLPRRKGGDERNVPPLRHLQPRAFPVQSAEGSVLQHRAPQPPLSRQEVDRSSTLILTSEEEAITSPSCFDFYYIVGI